MELNDEITGGNIPSEQKQLVDGCLKISTKLVYNRRSEYIQVRYILSEQHWFMSMWELKYHRWFSCITGLTYYKRNLKTFFFFFFSAEAENCLGKQRRKAGMQELLVWAVRSRSAPHLPGLDVQPVTSSRYGGYMEDARQSLFVLLCPTSFPSERGLGTWDVQEQRVHQRGPWAGQLRPTPTTHHGAHRSCAAVWSWKSFLLNAR